LEEINTLFDEARLAVKKAHVGDAGRACSDIVLILDNLEKIRRISGLDEGLVSQRELFLERYTQLTGMKAHFIFTVSSFAQPTDHNWSSATGRCSCCQ
jgi:hypothetical protein